MNDNEKKEFNDKIDIALSEIECNLDDIEHIENQLESHLRNITETITDIQNLIECDGSKKEKETDLKTCLYKLKELRNPVFEGLEKIEVILVSLKEEV